MPLEFPDKKPAKAKPKKFVGWSRRWGKPWRRECTGKTVEAVQEILVRDFKNVASTSTLVLEEGESPYFKEEATA